MKPLDQVRSVGADALNPTTKVTNNSEYKGSIMNRLMEFASSVPDFRRSDKGNIRHRLSDIIILIILAHMTKYVKRAEIIAFGKQNLNKLRSMGLLKNGVPSEPTLFRIEQGLDDLCMAEKMASFMDTFRRELIKSGLPDIICMDGKAMRGTVLDNGRNPDIVSAYSSSTGLTLATEACREKSNEIKAGPKLLDKLDIAGQIVTADAMSMQKDIIEKIRKKGADFVIELKANQPALRYGVEDRIKSATPLQVYTEGPELGHGRIETRTYSVYDGLDLIADKDKWGDHLTIILFKSRTIKKSTGAMTSETRYYVSGLRCDAARLASIVRRHWSIESMHWSLDCNFMQDRIKRKSSRAARNLDTFQRIAHGVFSIWRGRRKKRSDKKKGNAELMRWISASFTNLMAFLNQK